MRERSSADVLAHRTLFLFSAIFSNDQTRGWDIDDLSAFDVTGWNCVQIVLAGFTGENVLLHHFIWGGRPLQARSWMSWLPSRWFLALFAQAFRLSDETIRGRRQVAIVAIFREPLVQGFHLLGQTAVLLTQLLNQDVLLPEQRLLLPDQLVTLRQLLSQRDEFFFDRHALTLLPLMPLGKSPADLGSNLSVCN